MRLKFQPRSVSYRMAHNDARPPGQLLPGGGLLLAHRLVHLLAGLWRFFCGLNFFINNFPSSSLAPSGDCFCWFVEVVWKVYSPCLARWRGRLLTVVCDTRVASRPFWVFLAVSCWFVRWCLHRIFEAPSSRLRAASGSSELARASQASVVDRHVASGFFAFQRSDGFVHHRFVALHFVHHRFASLHFHHFVWHLLIHRTLFALFIILHRIIFYIICIVYGHITNHITSLLASIFIFLIVWWMILAFKFCLFFRKALLLQPGSTPSFWLLVRCTLVSFLWLNLVESEFWSAGMGDCAAIWLERAVCAVIFWISLQRCLIRIVLHA